MATPRTKRKHPSVNSPGEEEPSTCAICLDPIIDATEDTEGQEAIFCEGKCNAWLHRQCAGLSHRLFEIYQDKDDHFHCPNCRLIMQEHCIQELKSTIESLHKDILELKTQCNDNTVIDLPNSVPESQDGISQATSGVSTEPTTTRSATVQETATTASKNTDSKTHDDRKFNVVIYGINECDKGTNRSERLSHDLHNVTTIVCEGDNSVNPLSIRDLLRLGKYREQANKPRPILVRLNRTVDVSILLSKAAKSLPKGIKIKPDMTREERHIESLLLKERWSLMQSGRDRRAIKIRSNKIFVNNRLHGQVVNSSYVPQHSLTASSGMDTSND